MNQCEVECDENAADWFASITTGGIISVRTSFEWARYCGEKRAMTPSTMDVANKAYEMPPMSG